MESKKKELPECLHLGPQNPDELRTQLPLDGVGPRLQERPSGAGPSLSHTIVMLMKL